MRKLVRAVVLVGRKITHSPGWFLMGLRYALHGFLFVIDDLTTPSPKPRCTLRFYPYRPLPLYTIWGVCHALGVTMKRGTKGKVMFFADATTYTGSVPSAAKRWINGRCQDIRKSTISKLNAEVFGRPLAIDPTTYRGEAVEKSEENGMHDGSIITCPIPAPREGKVYQKAINNEVASRTIEDLRAVVVGHEVAFVYRKVRSIRDRFLNNQANVRIEDATSVFSKEEIAQILCFTQKLGLDFGEIDVLRDQGSGYIYIVDANNTSIYPPIGLTYRERKACVQRVADVFARVFLS